MSHKSWLLWSIAPVALVVLGIMALGTRPVTADSQPQVVYQTPTARPDGRVIYIVQANDSCLRIQLLTKVTIEQLRDLNKLDENCTIRPGQELLLAVIIPASSPTPNPKQSPTPVLPTPTVTKGNGKICVTLFEDVNGDAIHEDTEGPIAGGAVSITDQNGRLSETISTTEDPEPICKDVPEGKYNISMAIPSGYNPTKAMNTSAEVLAGDQAIFEFGAQKSTAMPESSGGTTTTPPPQSNSLPLAVVGGILILGGIGLGGYVLFTRRGPASSS